jgi:predicted O-linked N-acetylglucosamine transferase (SPINDLY family)
MPPSVPLLQQAMQRHQAGDLAGADGLYRQVLATAPKDFTARHMLGVIRLQQGRNGEAAELIAAALTIHPQSPEALGNLGHALRMLGRLEDSLKSLDASLALNPMAVQVLFSRAELLRQMQRSDAALAAYDRLLAVSPGLAGAHDSRAALLRSLHRLDEARAGHNKAVALEPFNAILLYNRGVTLRELNHLNEALADFDRAVAADGSQPLIHYARANTLWDLNRFEEALAAVDRALALNPHFSDAANLRGTILWDLGRPAEALAAYDRALAIQPDNPFARGAQANAVLHLCDWPRVRAIAATLEHDMAARRALISPLTLLGYPSTPALQLASARALLAERIPVRPAPLTQRRAYGHDRIRIAYLSHDFQDHPVAQQIAGVIEQHDRSRFEVTAIATGPDDGSALRQRLVRAFDAFIAVGDKSDAAVAQMLRAMEIDILVDLGGHTHGARIGILAGRPAPIQVSFLGFSATTGADFIDYVLADPVVVPFDQEPFYTEKIVHLPVSFMPNDASRRVAPAPTRASLGLPEDGFVFCHFNKPWKIGPDMFALWMRLLAQVPGSVLWLKDDGQPVIKTRFQDAARQAGIDPARLIFAGMLPAAEHLARHQAADLFLDSLPYNAHVTACDALWAGLPVLTQLGNCFAGRVAASLLTALELPELITDTAAAYEVLALALARDPARLAALRARLIANRQSGPLFDTARTTREIEAAFTAMMEQLARGEAPQPFALA